MNDLCATDALSDHVIQTEAGTRPADVLSQIKTHRATHVAVLKAGRFCGIVSLTDTLFSSPQRIFADLLPESAPLVLPGDTTLDELAFQMEEAGDDAAAVVDADGYFLGVVTRQSLCRALLNQKEQLLDETHRLRATIEADRNRLRERTIDLTAAVERLQHEIAERRRTEEDLRESEQRFRSLSIAAFEGIVVHIQGRIVEVNDSHARMFGYEPSEMIGKSPLKLTAPEKRELVREKILSGHEKPYESIGLRKDGSTFPCEVLGKAISYRGCAARVAAVRDITERKRAEKVLALAHGKLEKRVRERTAELTAVNRRLRKEIAERMRTEEALRRSEQRYRAYIETSAEGIYCVEQKEPIPIDAPEDEQIARSYRDSYVADCNDVLARMYGFRTAAEFVGTRLREIHAQTDPHNVEVMRDFIRSNYRLTDVESHELDKDGQSKHFLNNLVGIVENGKVVQVWGTQRDITERKRAEKALEEARKELEVRVHQRTAALISTNKRLGRETFEHKQTEMALQENQRFLERISDSGTHLIWVYDVVQERLVFANAAHAAFFGLPREQASRLPGAFLYDKVHTDDLKTYVAHRRRARKASNDELLDREFRLKNHTGQWRWLFARDVVLSRAADGSPQQILGLAVDITKRKEAERGLKKANRRLKKALSELRQTQRRVIQDERLRAIGQMASGIAHDLNNTLSPILGYAEMLLLDTSLSQKTRERLELIQTGARDAAVVVERLQEFYRPRNSLSSPEPVSLKNVVHESIDLTRPKWRDEPERTGQTIDVALDLPDVPAVRGNASELREMMTNLLLNAVDAMPAGGRITVRLRWTREFVVVEVSDTGVGMTVDAQKQCFEPFYTTKGAKGTGLGLSVCHGIVGRHGGHIEVDAAPGIGSSFRVQLPPWSGEHGLREAAPSEEAALARQRVLYIDDDPRVRAAVRQMLEQLGQQVDLAESGAAGLRKFHTNRYDVVVTDLGMAGLDGRQVTHSVRSLRPDVPVVMLTGWGSPLTRGGLNDDEKPDTIVGKPPTLAALRNALEVATTRRKA